MAINLPDRRADMRHPNARLAATQRLRSMMIGVLAMLSLTLGMASAQPDAAPVRFDVVSVKPSAVGERDRAMQILPGGTIRFVAVPLSMMLMPAYDVRAFQILGAPAWIRSDLWDVQAKVENVRGKLTIEQLRPMLQALLEDRFDLKAHRETKVGPAYALVVSKKGTRMRAHSTGDANVRNGSGSLEVTKGTMPWLAAWLSEKLQRVVTDQTGLSGAYDYVLEWSPAANEGSAIPLSAPPTMAEKPGPSIFTAIQEQLGLRLASRKRPVEMIVIDQVVRPAGN